MRKVSPTTNIKCGGCCSANNSNICGFYSMTIINTIEMHVERTCVFKHGDKRTNTIKLHPIWDWTTSSKCNHYSAFNNEHGYIWEDQYMQLVRNMQQICTSNNHNWIKWGHIFQYEFCWCFIVGLLLQYKFQCVNLISTSWRTWEQLK